MPQCRNCKIDKQKEDTVKVRETVEMDEYTLTKSLRESQTYFLCNECANKKLTEWTIKNS